MSDRMNNLYAQIDQRPRIAIIVGSTRSSRYADSPAQWMLKQAQIRGDMDVELVDLRDYPMPFFNEISTNLRVPTRNVEALRWQESIARFDGFIFVVAEYNHSITGVLKNALDQAHREWIRKPFTAIGYGGTGAARAIEHLRLIAIELQMVSTHAAVHISGRDFYAVHPGYGDASIDAIEDNLLATAKTALDELLWWARATMHAKVAWT